MGVRRALNKALDVSREKNEEPLATLGPLIHNPQTVKLLESKGIGVINEPEEMDDGTVIVRSHGIPPDLRKRIRQKGLSICDTTCPKVARVQGLIKKYRSEGYDVVIIGDPEHAEVMGLRGYADEKAHVIRSVEEAERLPETDKICLVSQTTQDHALFEEIAGVLKKRFGDRCTIIDTICDSTRIRQDEVKKLAEKVDAVIVVGGYRSANTSRLAEIVRSMNTPVCHVEEAGELPLDDLKQYHKIGVTAGASTPNWQIREVIDRLKELKWYRRIPVFKPLSRLFEFILESNLYIAFGAFCLSYAICALQSEEIFRISLGLIAGAYVLAMHILNRFTDKEALKYNLPLKLQFYEKYKIFLGTLGLTGITGAFLLSAMEGSAAFIIVFASSFLGLLYSLRIVPARLSRRIGFRRLKDLPASKDALVALAWATVTVIVPAASNPEYFGQATVASFVFVFLLVLLRNLALDIRDYQGDRIVGKESLPILIGLDNTWKLIRINAFVLVLSLVFANIFKITPNLSRWLLIPVFYNIIYLYIYHKFYQKALLTHNLIHDFILDSSFVLTGMISLLWVYWT